MKVKILKVGKIKYSTEPVRYNFVLTNKKEKLYGSFTLNFQTVEINLEFSKVSNFRGEYTISTEQGNDTINYHVSDMEMLEVLCAIFNKLFSNPKLTYYIVNFTVKCGKEKFLLLGKLLEYDYKDYYENPANKRNIIILKDMHSSNLDEKM